MSRCLVTIAFLVALFGPTPSTASVQANSPPQFPSAIEQIEARPDAFDWVMPRYGASAAGREAWSRLVAQARATARRRTAEAQAALREKGFQPLQQGADSCFGDEACDWVMLTERTAAEIDGWERFSAAWMEARPVLAAVTATARRTQESIRRIFPAGGPEAELHARFVHEQLLRAAYADPSPTLSPDGRRLFQLALGMLISRSDRANADWLRQLLEESGWPRIPAVSRQAETSAWFMLVHARHDPLLRLRALELMREMVARGELSGAAYATRLDHILFEVTGLQRFGTRGKCDNGRFVPEPSESEARVPELRSSVGLPTLEEQARMMSPGCQAASAVGDISGSSRSPGG